MSFKVGDIVVGKPGLPQEGIVAKVVSVETDSFTVKIIKGSSAGWEKYTGAVFCPEWPKNYSLSTQEHSIPGLNSKCPRCGSPAYLGFVTVECSARCHEVTSARS